MYVFVGREEKKEELGDLVSVESILEDDGLEERDERREEGRKVNERFELNPLRKAQISPSRNQQGKETWDLYRSE